MKENKIKILTSFFQSLEDLKSEDLMNKVEEYLTDEDIEIFVDHIESFYGIKDDEELGMLAQIMITGYLAAQYEDKMSSSDLT